MTPAPIPEAAELAGKLTAAQVDALVNAKLADSHEWWLVTNPGLPLSIAGSDWVVTPFGLAVRALLLKDRSHG